MSSKINFIQFLDVWIPPSAYIHSAPRSSHTVDWTYAPRRSGEKKNHNVLGIAKLCRENFTWRGARRTKFKTSAVVVFCSLHRTSAEITRDPNFSAGPLACMVVSCAIFPNRFRTVSEPQWEKVTNPRLHRTNPVDISLPRPSGRSDWDLR